MTTKVQYPWFEVAAGDELQQGDVLDGCPVFMPPDELTEDTGKIVKTPFLWYKRDLIVMSQSCDLVRDLERKQEKVEDVLLCMVWKRSELPPEQAKSDWMERARKGQLPGFHVLAASHLPNFEREVRIVDFRRVYSLPISFVRNRASMSERLRLLPPYREHLSQSFARFFMRVGLPIDIPPFKK